MKLDWQSFFPLVLLMLLSALTFFLERATHVSDTADDEQNRQAPDFIVENFQARSFAPDGTLQNTLSAQKMLHYADMDSSEIINPILTYTVPNQLSHINANRAIVGKDSKKILFTGNVRVQRDATTDHPEQILTTDQLTVFPDDKIVKTEALVTFTQGKSIIQGIGFSTNSEQKITVLQSHVTATIENRQASTP